MNYRVVYLLLSIFIVESFGCGPASERDRNANWKKDLEKRHVDSVNSIINGVMNRVKKYADEKGTSLARNCYEDAKQLLLDLSSNGENEVRRCIEIADTEVNGDNCCYEIQSIIGTESTKLALTATRCIYKASRV